MSDDLFLVVYVFISAFSLGYLLGCRWAVTQTEAEGERKEPK